MHDDTFTYLDKLMESLSACILEGSLQVQLTARQTEVNLDLLAIAHLQTTIAANVLVLARKLMDLPCEIREQIMECTGIHSQRVHEIVRMGEDITCATAIETAASCLQNVLQCLDTQNREDFRKP